MYRILYLLALALCLTRPASAMVAMMGGGTGALCSPTAMLDAVVSDEGNDVSSLTTSFTISAGTNRRLMVMVSAAEEVEALGHVVVSSVTYNGVSLGSAVVAHQYPTGADIRAELWSMPDANLPAPGAHNVVVTLAGAVEDIAVSIFSVECISQGAPADTDTADAGTADPISLSFVGIESGYWGFAMHVDGNSSGTSTTSTGGTELFDFVFGTVAGANNSGYRQESADTTMTITIDPTQSGGQVVAIGAVWGQ